MTLNFPNASRHYNPTQRCVCFWGHDSAFEISFHLDEEALCKISPFVDRNEASLLHVFDVNRLRIQESASIGLFAAAAELLSTIGVGYIGPGPSWSKTWRKTWAEVTGTAIARPRSRKS
jgi:Protein of unknown function (DUF1488)